MDKEWETKYVQVNGVRIHIRTAGPEKGKLVVLLHGFPEDSYAWKNQIQALAQNGYRVVAPDQRGYYTSSKPEKIKAYQLDELAKDIMELIHFFQREKAFIVGHDWGGVVGWYLASLYPHCVEKLVILNVPHPAAFIKAATFYPPQWLRSAYILFFQLPCLPEKLLQKNDYNLLGKAMAFTARPGTFSEQELNRYKRSWKKSGTVSGMLNWYRALRSQPLWKIPDPAPHVPVRMIWGRKDVALTLKMAKESLKRCPDGQLILLDEGTHWLYHEYPLLINQWIIRFLKETTSEATEGT